MKYTVLSLFPEIINTYFSSSIMAKAVNRGLVTYSSLNIRDFSLDRHKTCDDAPYGGGPGMLMLAEPLARALHAAGAVKKGGSGSPEGWSEGGPDNFGHDLGGSSGNRPPFIIYLSPSGIPFNQNMARRLAARGDLVLICGRYEGIDQRIIDTYVDAEISVGDYVLSSGEAAALILIDATYRLVEQVITPESLEEESFNQGLLEYPQYTRPEVYDMIKVPDVLLSGHHGNIRRWRLEKQVEKTLCVRPELIQQGLEQGLFDAEIRTIIEIKRGRAQGSGHGEEEI